MQSSQSTEGGTDQTFKMAAVPASALLPQAEGYMTDVQNFKCGCKKARPALVVNLLLWGQKFFEMSKKQTKKTPNVKSHIYAFLWLLVCIILLFLFINKLC